MIYEKLKDYLDDRRIKQTEVADALNTTPQRVSQIFNGKVRLCVDDLEEICVHFNVDPALFFEQGNSNGHSVN